MGRPVRNTNAKGERWCKDCEDWKPAEEFHILTHGKHDSYCKEHRKVRSKIYSQRLREKRKAEKVQYERQEKTNYTNDKSIEYRVCGIDAQFKCRGVITNGKVYNLKDRQDFLMDCIITNNLYIGKKVLKS